MPFALAAAILVADTLAGNFHLSAPARRLTLAWMKTAPDHAVDSTFAASEFT
jgi:hypothetical protein